MTVTRCRPRAIIACGPFLLAGSDAMTTHLLSGHDGPSVLSGGHPTLQDIADVLAGSGLHAVRLDDLEAAAIRGALAACNGNRTRAAEQLGISVRTLQRKLKEN